MSCGFRSKCCLAKTKVVLRTGSAHRCPFFYNEPSFLTGLHPMLKVILENFFSTAWKGLFYLTQRHEKTCSKSKSLDFEALYSLFLCHIICNPEDTHRHKTSLCNHKQNWEKEISSKIIYNWKHIKRVWVKWGGLRRFLRLLLLLTSLCMYRSGHTVIYFSICLQQHH